jgi:hypothetical protein
VRLDKHLVVVGVVLAVVVAAGTLAACLAAPSPGTDQAESAVQFTSADPIAGVEIRVPDLGWDRPLGTTPFSATVALPAGPHTYLAAAPGYRTVSEQFTVTAALEPLHVQVPALARSGGQIEVRSSAVAQVAVDGRADFYWGSRLVVTVEPTGLISLTVMADDRPTLTCPPEYDRMGVAHAG